METLNHDNKKGLYSNNNNHASSTAEVQVDNIPKEKSKEGIYLLLFISSRCTEIYILHEINVFFLCEISCETDTNMFEATFRIKLEFLGENLHRFLLEIRCSLFFQIYTKKPLNITREQKRRSSTPSLAPCSTIYTSLWSSQFWVEGLAMEVLHVRAPPHPICIFLSCQDLRLQ